jgi:hypothetical protein
MGAVRGVVTRRRTLRQLGRRVLVPPPPAPPVRVHCVEHPPHVRRRIVGLDPVPAQVRPDQRGLQQVLGLRVVAGQQPGRVPQPPRAPGREHREPVVVPHMR